MSKIGTRLLPNSNLMFATTDAFFVDITSELKSTDASWGEIINFLNLQTIYPLRVGQLHYTGLGDQDIDALLKEMTPDIQIFRMRSDIPTFLVHRGALATVRKMFRISHCQWFVNDVFTEIKKGQYTLRPTLRDFAQLSEVSERAKSLCNKSRRRD